MKKLLSIVLCVLLGVTSTIFAQGTVTFNAYALGEGISQATNATIYGGGTITITGKSASINRLGQKSWNQAFSETGTSITNKTAKEGYYKGLFNDYKAGVKVTLSAVPADGYYFDGFTETNSLNPTTWVNRTSPYGEVELPYKGSNYTKNYYAIFKPVEISNATAATIATTDLNGTNTVTVVFSVTYADNEDDFQTPTVSGSGFTIDSWNYADNKVSVVVRFTDFNKDNVNGDTKPTFKGTVTLKSAGGEKSGTATITATSDLTPRTTITSSPCDLTPSSPVLAGNTVSEKLTVAAVDGYTKVVNAATWTVKFTDPDDARRKGYTLDATNPKAPIVRFTPTEFSINQANVETEICVTTAYTDANGKVITHTECVTITADAGKLITIGGVKDAVMDFGIIDYTATNVPVSIEYPIYTTLAASAFTKTATDFDTDISCVEKFTGSGATDDKLTVTVNSTMVPNDYTATLTYTENVADPISASLTVKVSIKLAKPEVTATVPDGNVTLTWPAVYGANRYIIKSEGVEIATVTATTYKVTKIGGQELTIGRQYPFTVTAVYDANPEKGNRESDIVNAIPCIPTVITYGDINDINMYTGTEKGAGDGGVYESFPYSKKRKIELNRIFDETGNPLFDELYIFGVTTETDGTHDNINLPSTKLGCNATTPLYVYTKSGNEYVKTQEEYDAVKKRFDHGASKNGQHLYFTGYCPFANIGVEADDEGWMYFVGGNEKVDIYLDNCTIIGRYRTTDGKSTGFKNKTVSLVATNFFGGDNLNYMTGFSSVFVFESSSNVLGKSYKPTIHISGNNHLKGQRGYITSVVGNLLGVFDGIETGIGNVRTVSSPITIKPTSKGGYTDLTMDDLWPTKADYSIKEVTNGFLRLDTYENPGEASEKVPCVDLGSEYGSLTINGGQYMLRNSAADGSYTCNMAFGYRKFSREAEKYGVKALLSLYGFGGDETKAPVVINGGTFNMYKNMYPSGTSYLGANYYIDQDNFLDLRLPAGSDSRPSSINGGTFNGISHVVFCSQVISSGRSPKAMCAGADLCLQDVIIEDPAVARQENGSVHFSIPTPFSDYYSDPKVEYNLSTGLEHVASKDQLVYGGQSVNAYEKKIDGVDKTVVSLLLPIAACEGSGETCTDCELFEEAIYYNWVTAIPKFEVNVKGQGVSVGGEANVPTISGTTIKYVVNQLLYTDLEGMENATMTGDINISFANSTDVRGQFTNTDNYRIYKNLNILKVVEADRWYCFVAPYDIHEISVIETAETQLSQEQYQKDRTAAKALQAKNNLTLFYELSDFILPDPNGRATSLTLNKLLCNGCLGVPGLRRIPLYHYNGQKAADENYGRPVMTANYYLYETTNSGFDKTTTTNAKDTFLINWTPVSRAKGEPLMRQGHVYAIQFPWCPMCNDWETREYYDYWTNKMILFYGHGYDMPGTENDGQLIYGIKGQTALTAAPGPGQAVYAGNYSFANMTPPSNAFVHDYDVDKDKAANPDDWFIPAPNDHEVKPTEGFLLYNPGGSKMPARISRTGKIEYDENVETGVGGVPTISDRTSLMLFGAYDGFEILSLCEQLVTVYNLQGNIIFQQYMAEGEQVYVGTGAGIFVVRGESETIKVMVE